MSEAPIAASPLDVAVRALFERWYLDVVKGHPNNLQKDEHGAYIFVGQQFLAFEAATLLEREACAKLCDDLNREGDYIYGDECADAIRKRSNG